MNFVGVENKWGIFIIYNEDKIVWIINFYMC